MPIKTETTPFTNAIDKHHGDSIQKISRQSFSSDQHQVTYGRRRLAEIPTAACLFERVITTCVEMAEGKETHPDSCKHIVELGAEKFCEQDVYEKL